MFWGAAGLGLCGAGLRTFCVALVPCTSGTLDRAARGAENLVRAVLSAARPLRRLTMGETWRAWPTKAPTAIN